VRLLLALSLAACGGPLVGAALEQDPDAGLEDASTAHLGSGSDALVRDASAEDAPHQDGGPAECGPVPDAGSFAPYCHGPSGVTDPCSESDPSFLSGNGLPPCPACSLVFVYTKGVGGAAERCASHGSDAVFDYFCCSY
jgi:hypothetical protein